MSKQWSGVIPLPGFAEVQAVWDEINREGVSLKGFLVYHASDHQFPEYIATNGLSDLSIWISNRCVILLIHSPAAAWIDYATKSDHLLARLFNSGNIGEAITALKGREHKPLFSVDGNHYSLSQFLNPPLDQYWLADEIKAILDYFGCEPTEHPCLILFRSLDDSKYWYVDLRQWLNWELLPLRAAFRDYFDSSNFKRVLKEVTHV